MVVSSLSGGERPLSDHLAIVCAAKRTDRAQLMAREHLGAFCRLTPSMTNDWNR
jgi:hypothetical protein